MYHPSERRDSHGRWTKGGVGPKLGAVLVGHGLKGRGTGTGSATDPINVHGNVLQAAQLIGQGKHVRLNKVHDIGTLMTDLAKAKFAKGDFDLCRVSVPKTNLFCAQSKGIPRIQMPQLSGVPLPGSKAARELHPGPGEEVDLGTRFIDALRSHGVKVTDTRVPSASLKATQDQLVGPKVAGLEKFMETAPKDSPVWEPIFVTKDHYVIDGHHRWAANVALDAKDGRLGNEMMNVHLVDMDIGEALKAAEAFQQDWGLPSAGFENKSTVSHFANGNPDLSSPQDGGATMSLSVPIVSVQDGPRMSGKISNFGGKKAAPFGKGGKRVLAKALAKKARGKTKDMSNIDLSGYQPAPYDSDGEGSGEPVTCPKCGKGDARDARYCDQCGFKLAGAQGVKVKGKATADNDNDGD